MAASFSGPLGSLTVEVLRYEFAAPQDRSDEWLVVRALWEGTAARVRIERPCVTVHELEAWARRLGAAVREPGGGEHVFEFVEPNIALRVKRTPGGTFSTQIRLEGEPAGVGEHFSVRMAVGADELAAFARDLAAMAAAFPARA